MQRYNKSSNLQHSIRHYLIITTSQIKCRRLVTFVCVYISQSVSVWRILWHLWDKTNVNVIRPRCTIPLMIRKRRKWGEGGRYTSLQICYLSWYKLLHFSAHISKIDTKYADFQQKSSWRKDTQTFHCSNFTPMKSLGVFPISPSRFFVENRHT